MAEALTFENVESVTPVVNENTVNNNITFENVESISEIKPETKKNNL